MRRTFLALIASLASMAAVAQAPSPLGAVAEVNGLVTMSVGSQVGTVAPGTPVVEGARFVSSSSGAAELKFQDGCVVRLKPNESLVIAPGNTPCPERIASIVPVAGPAGGVFAGLPSGTLPLLGIAALTGVVARIQDREITPRPQ
jgi:hypothetical protein